MQRDYCLFSDLDVWFNIKEEHYMADYISQVVYRNRLKNGFFIESGSYESDQFSVRYRGLQRDVVYLS